MNPTIQPVKMSVGRSYYLVTFATLADRSRWLSQHDFFYQPEENCQARWVSNHNGSDYTHKLEIIPFDPMHSNNPRALCMRVYLIKRSEEESTDEPFDPLHPKGGRPSKSPSTKSSYCGETALERELNLPVYLRYSQS